MSMELNQSDILNPMEVLNDWMKEVSEAEKQPNPNCFSIATTNQEGSSNVRMVLCREINIVDGYVVFYSNYNSTKAIELAYQPKCSGVFHWDNYGYQIRIKGYALKSPQDESDDYFLSRSLGSQVAAWASQQSNSIGSRKDLESQFDKALKKFNIERKQLAINDKKLPRPPFWGGYRIWIHQIEIWLNQNDRFHDRLLFQRDLSLKGNAYISTQGWTKKRLQP